MDPTTPADTAYRIPLEETEVPFIGHCQANATLNVIPHTEGPPAPTTTEVVTLVSYETSNAYRKIPSKPEKSLNHHAPGWGSVFFGIVLPRVSEGLYQEPSPETVQYVAIKRLNRKAVETALQQGKKENPYVELLRMQRIGDNIHVLSCVEAVQDETYLYIIMPYCTESLVDCIPWNSGRGMDEKQARVYFEQIVENLKYLKSHGICHRDLSPDNCMIFNDRLLFTDLAMSFCIPTDAPNDLVQYNSTFGKPPYLPPEVFLQYPFNAFACDLWSAAVILFNMLTGEILCEMPHYSNLLFRYFILARGISSTQLNERMMEVLMDLERPEQMALWRIAQMVMSLHPDYLTLLDGLLQVAPGQRFQLDHVEDYLRQHP